MLAQFLKGARRDRVCVYAFIGMSVCAYVRALALCCVKKITSGYRHVDPCVKESREELVGRSCWAWE